MDQAKPDLFNSQAADAGMLGILQPRPGQLSELIQHWRGPRPLRVCSGGTTSRAAVDQGWTLDLREHFSQVHWDEADRTVLIEGGCRMGDVLAALLPYGRTITAGLSGLPGVGYVLTGGMGPLSRQVGLAVDNLQEIQGIWGNGDSFLLKREQHLGSAEWRGLCGAAPFLAVVEKLRLTTQPLQALWIDQSSGRPEQLPDWMEEAEQFASGSSLQWHWQGSGTLQRMRISSTEEPVSQRIEGLHQLPPLAAKPDFPQRLHGEVLGLLGPAGVESWRTVLPKLSALMLRCPHPGCSLSCQQIGAATSRESVDVTSFVHRDAMWKPWITAVWPAGDEPSRQSALAWLEELWGLLQPLCPGVHLAQLHDHLPFHQRELDQAFGTWLAGLRRLKADRDPDGNLPSL